MINLLGFFFWTFQNCFFFFFFLVNKHLWTFLPNCIFLSWKITIISLNVLLFNMQFFLLFLKIKKKNDTLPPQGRFFFSLNMNYRFKKIKGRVSFSKMRGERYHFLKPQEGWCNLPLYLYLYFFRRFNNYNNEKMNLNSNSPCTGNLTMPLNYIALGKYTFFLTPIKNY